MRAAIREKLRSVLNVKGTPHHIALSFAIGLFWGLSPFLGLHIVFGIATAWALRLNKLVTMTGVLLTNPLTLVPVYTFTTWVGAHLLGVDIGIDNINLSEVSFLDIMEEFKDILLPFFVGAMLVSIVGALASYVIVKTAIQKVHDHRLKSGHAHDEKPEGPGAGS